jgi:hypothetical protein
VAVSPENIPIFKNLSHIRLQIMIKDSKTTIVAHKKIPEKAKAIIKEKQILLSEYNAIIKTFSVSLLREYYEYSEKFKAKVYQSTINVLYSKIKDESEVLKNYPTYSNTFGLKKQELKLAIVRSYLEFFAFRNSIGRSKHTYKKSLIKECFKYSIDPQIWFDCEARN